MFKNLIPKIFYSRLDDGLEFFVDVLGFELAWRDATLAVVERDGAKAYLMENAELAALDRPELAIETDAIDAIHAEMSARAPERLHPNLPNVQLRPWGAREFAMLDKTTVCVVFREWPEEDAETS
jgi:catechol 2,3-dioxygenase-like lactoylglutathione lyase family enzyme